MYVRLSSDCRTVTASLSFLLLLFQSVGAAPLPIVKDVEWQPFAAQIKRLIEAADYVGSPLSAKEKKGIEAAMDKKNGEAAAEKIQAILDEHCLFGVQINPEMRVKVA